MEHKQVNEPIDTYHTHYTYADYLRFGYEEMVEIIRGKIFRMSPAPSTEHQRVSRKLLLRIDKFLESKKCEVFSAPFDVILPVKGKDFMASDKVVQPDIVVICDPSKIKEKGCFGAPDWIIEILSPHTTRKDLQDKFDIYEESGVKEYWVVEPLNSTVEVFVLEGGQYRRIRTYVQDDVVPCHTIEGLSIDLNDIFEIRINS